MIEVIADGQPAHHRRTGAGQHCGANRCGRSEFERMGGGLRLIAVFAFRRLVGAEQEPPPRFA
ncbi:Uncharacterised protein [Mycobacterium tuberculosis]|nr:Uncharacterised protein [Mycobacterium tuberculosis]